MIGKVLQQVATKLGNVINEIDDNPIGNIQVEVGNVSQLDGDDAVSGNILLSLVNVEQDVPLRNNPAYSAISDTQIKRHNPKIVLNLYTLFSIPQGQNRVTELDYLTYVIAAFQRQNVFTPNDFDNPAVFNTGHLQTEKIIFDQYSMTFEQLNHLWGILGGKYLPSVLYKVRLICVFVDEDKEPESTISSIEREEEVIN